MLIDCDKAALASAAEDAWDRLQKLRIIEADQLRAGLKGDSDRWSQLEQMKEHI